MLKKVCKIFNAGLTVRQEQRDDGQSDTIITGRAIVFDEYQKARDSWGDNFYERISSSVQTTNFSGIHLLYNHNYDTVLGREGKNVTIQMTNRGLDFEWVVPKTSKAQEIATLVRQGVIDGCSFGFYIEDQTWEERNDTLYRTIEKIELLEITITPIPFYTSTYVRTDENLRINDVKKEVKQSDEKETSSKASSEKASSKKGDTEKVIIESEFRAILLSVRKKRALELLAIRFKDTDTDIEDVYKNLLTKEETE